MQRFYWYDAYNDSVATTDRESGFGLFRQPTSLAPGAWVPKPAAAADGVASRLLAGRRFMGVATTASNVRVYSFTGKHSLRVMWSTKGASSVLSGHSAKVYSVTGARVKVTRRGGRIRVVVGASPLYVLT